MILVISDFSFIKVFVDQLSIWQQRSSSTDGVKNSYYVIKFNPLIKKKIMKSEKMVEIGLF